MINLVAKSAIQPLLSHSFHIFTLLNQSFSSIFASLIKHRGEI